MSAATVLNKIACNPPGDLLVNAGATRHADFAFGSAHRRPLLRHVATCARHHKRNTSSRPSRSAPRHPTMVDPRGVGTHVKIFQKPSRSRRHHRVVIGHLTASYNPRGARRWRTRSTTTGAAERRHRARERSSGRAANNKPIFHHFSCDKLDAKQPPSRSPGPATTPLALVPISVAMPPHDSASYDREERRRLSRHVRDVLGRRVLARGGRARRGCRWPKGTEHHGGWRRWRDTARAPAEMRASWQRARAGAAGVAKTGGRASRGREVGVLDPNGTGMRR